MKIAALTLALFLALVATAQAATPLEVGVQRAETFWADKPYEGNFTISYGPMMPGIEEVGYASYSAQHIQLDEQWWPNVYRQVEDWPNLCHTITHEVGHLVLGPTYFASVDPTNVAHSADSHDIMYPHVNGVYPSTCAPATFTMPNDEVWRWTYKHHSMVAYVTKRGHTSFWGSQDDISIEYPSEAREVH